MMRMLDEELVEFQHWRDGQYLVKNLSVHLSSHDHKVEQIPLGK
jgi:hypothetical protein